MNHLLKLTDKAMTFFLKEAEADAACVIHSCRCIGGSQRICKRTCGRKTTTIRVGTC